MGDNLIQPDDGLFVHKCVTRGCTHLIEYDDEPKCFEHSPAEGSFVAGYSARKAATHPSKERG